MSKPTLSLPSKRTCILGQCDNCKTVSISDDLKHYLPNVQDKNVHYNVFETIETQHYNNSGKLVSYIRTARVDEHDSVETIINKLQVLAEKYLLHHFFVINDKVHWKKFLQATQYYTLWLDYSQNIAFTEKKQVQSTHFSVRQYMLHNQSPKAQMMKRLCVSLVRQYKPRKCADILYHQEHNSQSS